MKYNYNVNKYGETTVFSLDEIMTASEAAEEYGFAKITIRKACQEGRFPIGHYKKSNGTWIVTKIGMKIFLDIVNGESRGV